MGKNSSSSHRYLILRGVRQHNLKGFDLDLPHGQLIAITGLSGSGKSSLAFDTIFAEGQRRFIDSLSTYARQFLEKMERPNVEKMENVQPTIAIEQKNPVKTSRSTVGTVTEIYDYLRLLYAKVGKTICPDCGIEVKPDTVQEVIDTILQEYVGKNIYLTFPQKVPPNRKEFLGRLGTVGLTRSYIDGDQVDLINEPLKSWPDVLEIVADRVVPSEGDRVRLSEAVENCYQFGEGIAHLFEAGDTTPRAFNQHYCCSQCGGKFLEPSPLLFSFNSPFGACPKCNGFGNNLLLDERMVVPNPDLSLNQGAIDPLTKPSFRRWGGRLLDFAKKQRIPLGIPYKDLTTEQKNLLWEGKGRDRGIRGYFEKLERKKYKMQIRVFLSRYKSPFICEGCGGGRLRGDASTVKLGKLSIQEVSSKNIEQLLLFISEIRLGKQDQEIAKDLVKEIQSRLGFLKDVGLTYLTVDRATKSLSGGEAQRIMLASQLGSRLFRTTYVLDEPSIGLHPRDNQRLLDLLKRLRDLSNTVLVVEHDAPFIEGADYVVELGPKSGEKGGEVMFAGETDQFLSSNTLTAKYLRGEMKVAEERERRLITRGKPTKYLVVEGASANNLKNINVKIPLERLVCITGVSGSGKSTLLEETLYPALDRLYNGGTIPMGPFLQLTGFSNLTGVVLLDQQAIGKSPRSNPVTYLKAFDEIRKLYSDLPESRSRGYTPGTFSFNVTGGRCETCQGEGYQKVEMGFMADLYLLCDECQGRRYKREVMEVTFKGKSIADVLEMTFSEARSFFQSLNHTKEHFQLMVEVGLGYLRLGQPANTLSGGEAQRLKIARELSSEKKKKQIYLLDEPTTGLHPHDISLLLKVLNDLVEEGHSVVIIEHNLDVIRSADWIIDLGPEGGDEGGWIIAEGTPAQVAKIRGSYTGQFLARH